MKKLNKIIIITLLAVLCACSDDDNKPNDNNNYFEFEFLKVGNKWEYEYNYYWNNGYTDYLISTGNYSTEIIAVNENGGNKSFSIQTVEDDYVDDPVEIWGFYDRGLYDSDTSVYQHGYCYFLSGADIGDINYFYFFIPNPKNIKSGEKYTAYILSGGDTITTITEVVSINETVKVQAGTFNKCIKVKLTHYPSEDIASIGYFNKNGLIKLQHIRKDGYEEYKWTLELKKKNF